MGRRNVVGPLSELRLIDHTGEPFDLAGTLPSHKSTTLYTFRGHW
jgi:hypothetical protein